MRTIRARLTLVYAALLMATLIALGAALYVEMARALQREALVAVQSLANQAARVLGSVGEQTGERDHQGVSFDLEDPELAQMLAGGGFYLEVYDARGRAVSRSASLRGQPLLAPPVDAARATSGGSIRRIARIGRALVYVVPVRRGDQLIGTVAAGRTMEPTLRTLAQLRELLVGGTVLSLGVALAGGWLLAGAALRPVDRLTRAARSITAGAMQQRLRLRGPNDELHRLAAAFDEMLDRLEQAFERERQFTANAAHELRTPLAILHGEIDVALRRVRAPEEYHETLGSLREEVVRLSRIVEDLLLLARADAGMEPVRREPVVLDEILHRVTGQFAAAAARQAVSLTLEGPRGVLLAGDGDRLGQAFSNLVDNAMKHVHAGGTITLRWRASADAVHVECEDTGEGIAPEDLPRIFDRFYRGTGRRSREQEGVGLGLAITKWIIDAHGGTITVDCRPGAYTRFSVTLPRARAVAST
jgi:heavy metal sensor kinase